MNKIKTFIIAFPQMLIISHYRDDNLHIYIFKCRVQRPIQSKITADIFPWEIVVLL